ncbi:MAG TPA: lipoprotein [Gammaproteobacteria bacterium]|jgi:predicted small lipoprotein YifL|nr:lipoprotein [Gammaproteobacteria bacterium]
MARSITIFMTVCCLLSACGQTGTLYLPDKHQQYIIQDNMQKKGA